MRHSAVPDLTDGIITVRIAYSPKFDLDTYGDVHYSCGCRYLTAWVFSLVGVRCDSVPLHVSHRLLLGSRLSSVSFVNDAPHPMDYMMNMYKDWSVGMGQLRIYFNNETRPSLTVPLNLDYTIKTDNGYGAWEYSACVSWGPVVALSSLYLDSCGLELR